MARMCRQCGKELHRYQTSNLCHACQEKRLEKMITDDEELVDAEGYADMLGLDSAEQLKRIARNGLLAPRIPGIKKWLWRKDDIDTWFKQKQQAGNQERNRDFRMIARGIASNLRTCRNDPIICSSLSDNIGGKVYGAEYTLGTGYKWEVGPIELVKVDRSMALNVLKQLPKEDFPELIGIADWADMTYDKINEDFIVRLEAYF